MADKKFLGVVLLFFVAIVLVISPPNFLNNAFGSDSNKNKSKNINVALLSDSTPAPMEQNNVENKQPENKNDGTNDNLGGETKKTEEVSTTMKPQAPTTTTLPKTTKPSQKPKSSTTNSKKETGPLRYEFDDPSESELESLRDSCSVLDLERAAYYFENSQNKSLSRWLFRNWCSRFTKLPSPFVGSKRKQKQQKEKGESLDPLPFRLSSDQLRSLFQDQVTLFVGDSVVRNHFVLTMARMCNEEHRGKCMIMMPTYEYDIVKPDATQRGPLGCIPQAVLDERINSRKGKKTTKLSPRSDEDQKKSNDNDEVTSSQQEASDPSSTPSISSSFVKKKSTGRAMKGIYKKPRIARPGPSSPSTPNENQDGGEDGSKQGEVEGGNQNKKEQQQQQQQPEEEKRSARALEEDEKANNNEDSSPPSPAISRPTSPSPTTSDTTTSSVDSDNLFAAAAKARQSAKFESLTDCYRNGTFEFVPAPGLTTSREPRRSERKAFLKKGVITPLIRMEVNKAVFYYVPVNTPKQIVKFGKWLAIRAGKSRIGSEMTKAKTVFVSTGPHLSMPEMNSSMQLLKPALSFIRSSLGADSSVLLAETTHLLNGPAWYSDFVDGVMDEWRRELFAKENDTSKSGAFSTKNGDGDNDSSASKNPESPIVDFVPQRFVTIGGHFSTWNNPNAGFVREQDGKDKLRKIRRTCMYYDAQHPAADCQEILTELMLMAAYASRARKSRDFLKSQRNQL